MENRGFSQNNDDKNTHIYFVWIFFLPYKIALPLTSQVMAKDITAIVSRKNVYPGKCSFNLLSNMNLSTANARINSPPDNDPECFIKFNFYTAQGEFEITHHSQ